MDSPDREARSGTSQRLYLIENDAFSSNLDDPLPALLLPYQEPTGERKQRVETGQADRVLTLERRCVGLFRLKSPFVTQKQKNGRLKQDLA